MENIKINSNVAQTSHQGHGWSKKQGNMLTKSLLIAGFAFFAIALLGYGFGYAITSSSSIEHGSSTYQILNVVGLVLILASMIMSMIWMFKIQKASMFFGIATIGVYIIGQAAGFAIIFAVNNISDMIIIFGITGGLFIIMAAIGSILSNKAALSLGKMLMIGSIAYMIIALPLMFIGIFMWSEFLDWWYWLSYGLMGLLSLGYIAFDINRIQKMQEWAMISQNDKMITNLTLFFGFKLLADLVGLLWVVASFFMRAKR